MFGDAFSPYLIGALADAFKPLISPSNSTVIPDPVEPVDPVLRHTEGFPSLPFGSDDIDPSPEEFDLEFRALEYSLFSCCFFQVEFREKNFFFISHNSGSWSILLLRGVILCDQ